MKNWFSSGKFNVYYRRERRIFWLANPRWCVAYVCMSVTLRAESANLGAGLLNAV